MRLIFATSYVSWRSPLDRFYYSRDYLSGSDSGMGKSSQEGMGACPNGDGGSSRWTVSRASANGGSKTDPGCDPYSFCGTHLPQVASIYRASDKTNSRKFRLLHPAANPALVGQVLLSEGAFQVLLLALDLVALDYVQHQRQQQD